MSALGAVLVHTAGLGLQVAFLGTPTDFILDAMGQANRTSVVVPCDIMHVAEGVDGEYVHEDWQ
jgi:hypothetical protein